MTPGPGPGGGPVPVQKGPGAASGLNAARPSLSAAEPWRHIRRLLAIRLDNLGDVLMTTPALVALRAGLPEAEITLLCSASGAAAAEHLPWIDHVLRFDAPWVAAGANRPDDDPGLTERALVERLAAGGFDAAVIFTVCTQSALPAALLCRMAGIALRLAHSRENPYGLLTHWVRDDDRPVAGMRHEVTRQLDLVAAVGFAPPADTGLQLAVPADARLHVRRLLAGQGIEVPQTYLVVHPGASAASRRYPASFFGRAAEALARRSGCRVVVVGGTGDDALVAEVARELSVPPVCWVGQLDLAELAALIEGAAVTLCNNSAPAHVAAAVEAPVVVLYALTNPQHTPWRARSRVLNQPVDCRDCLRSVCPQGHHDCLLKVEPAQVVDAALALMQGPGPSALRPGRPAPPQGRPAPVWAS